MPEATQPLTHRAVVTRTTFRQQIAQCEPDRQHVAHAVLNAVLDGQRTDSFRSVVARFGTVIGAVW